MLQLGKKQQQILDGFKEHGNHTTLEMSGLLGIPINVVSGRISELVYKLYQLEKKGTVKQKGGRPITIWGVPETPITFDEILLKKHEHQGEFTKLKIKWETYEILDRERIKQYPDRSLDEVIDNVIRDIINTKKRTRYPIFKGETK